VIHEQAKIGPNVTICPYAVVDAGAEIGAGTMVGPFAYVGSLVHVGESCILHAHSVIREYCWLGNRVILQPGAVIGSCGFGYSTNEKGEHIKLNQIGNVVLEDDVEIGANTTIDRARFKTTRVAKGTKIDNLVQIAHNVELGEHNILAAQTGVAGSSKTGRNVIMGGQVGIVGHVEIAPFTLLATRSGVSKSLPKSGKYAGGPVVSLTDHNKMQVHFRKIDEYAKRIEALEAIIANLNLK
jgi:UDP-3-O-[3-hydroxymyristoyl] glucosamine N-acyltransferase